MICSAFEYHSRMILTFVEQCALVHVENSMDCIIHWGQIHTVYLVPMRCRHSDVAYCSIIAESCRWVERHAFLWKKENCLAWRGRGALQWGQQLRSPQGGGQASEGTTPSAPTQDGRVPLVLLGLEDQVTAPRWSLQHKESCMSPRVGRDSLYIGDQHGMKIINLGLGTIC